MMVFVLIILSFFWFYLVVGDESVWKPRRIDRDGLMSRGMDEWSGMLWLKGVCGVGCGFWRRVASYLSAYLPT